MPDNQPLALKKSGIGIPYQAEVATSPVGMATLPLVQQRFLDLNIV